MRQRVLHSPGLEPPEGCFAVRCKDFRYRSVLGDDDVIGVDEGDVEDAPNALADARLARGGRPDQHEKRPAYGIADRVGRGPGGTRLSHGRQRPPW